MDLLYAYTYGLSQKHRPGQLPSQLSSIGPRTYLFYLVANVGFMISSCDVLESSPVAKAHQRREEDREGREELACWPCMYILNPMNLNLLLHACMQASINSSGLTHDFHTVYLLGSEVMKASRLASELVSLILGSTLSQIIGNYSRL